MKERIVINEQKLKFYSTNQLRYSDRMISNFREEISDKETLVNYILKQLKCNKVDEVRWSCFLQELMTCIEIQKVPENWEELKTMCEELESQTSDVTCDVLKDKIDLTIWNIDRSFKVGFADFYYDGDKVHLSMGTGFSIPIEIPKVWLFIKSLIGEE